jgi:GNAT superfamily N-acetyltransferase
VEVSLRTGDDRDLMAVGELHFRSREAAYAHIVGDAEGIPAAALGEWWRERWRWEQDTHRLTVAELDGEIVGFTYVGPSEVDDVAELYAIHVRPELVGHGVGRLLMIDALGRLAAIARTAVLWVLEENAVARDFYARGGWAPDGETRVEAVSGVPVKQLRYARDLVGGSARPE